MNERDFAFLDDEEELGEVQVNHSIPIQKEGGYTLPFTDPDAEAELTQDAETPPQSTATEGGYTIPFDQAEQLETHTISSLIHKIARQETALARDIAYFGKSDLDYILEGYNLTHAELLEKLNNPRFAQMVEKYASDIGDDYEGLMRVRAKAYLETMGLTRLQQVINDPRTKDENVIKAVTLMSQLGGAMPKNTGEGSGTHIVFNFGEKNPFIKPKRVIEHE